MLTIFYSPDLKMQPILLYHPYSPLIMPTNSTISTSNSYDMYHYDDPNSINSMISELDRTMLENPVANLATADDVT